MTKLMSVVALATILGTGAQAFDTNTTGDLLNRNAKAATYEDTLGQITPIGDDLKRPRAIASNLDALKGDALIFPAFKMGEGWESEFVFRNNHPDKAVLAKVVVYSADDSSEIVDFNVYLSQKDQSRFTMTNGQIKSSDGSIVTAESFANNDETAIKFADEVGFELNVEKQNGEVVNEGYIIVYAMAQTQNTDQGFHDDHRGLWKAYREQLDAQRPGWEIRTNYREGVYTEGNISVPNIELNGTVFENPAQLSLSGTGRVYNPTGEIRDLLITATTLGNFTRDNTAAGLLWAPGEYATLADRCIVIGADGYGDYDKTCLDNDTVTFTIADATYTYENATGGAGNVANKFVITQPTKRTLVQIGSGDAYWSNIGCNENIDDGSAVATGRAVGFQASLDIRDEAEFTIGESADALEQITSPYRPEIGTESAYCTELVQADNIEQEDSGFAADKNGFVTMTFSGKGGLPAIVSQMTASRVDDDSARINWVYSPTNFAF